MFLFSYSGFAEQIVCRIDAELCGNSCYDPSTQVCLNSTRICSKSQKLCGRTCYSPSEESYCSDRGLVWKKGQLTCPEGSDCFDPLTHQCTSNGIACPIGQDSCDWSCYDPAKEVCMNKEDHHFLCSHEDSVCGSSCYSKSDDSMVCMREGFLCEAGESACGYSCYTPDTGETCHNGNVLCQAGEESCGDECYDPLTETCFNDTKVCGSGREPCGSSSCYWPITETCFEERPGYSASSCPKGQEVCGYKCYDPEEGGCYTYQVGGSITILETICPVGEQLCGQKCYSPTKSGKKCFDDTLCNEDEEICGRRCYKPNTHPYFKCYNGTALCDQRRKPCGQHCYRPKIHKCLEIQ